MVARHADSLCDRSSTSISTVSSPELRRAVPDNFSVIFLERQSVHFEREKGSKLEAIRQRAGAKSRRELSESSERINSGDFYQQPNRSTVTFNGPSATQSQQNIKNQN